MMILVFLLGAAQPCMPAQACPTRREIEQAYWRWVDRSIAGYLAEQAKSGDVVTATAVRVRHFEHISCAARAGDGGATVALPPVQCRFTTVNKGRRLTYVAGFSHHGDLWEIDSARSPAATLR
jgi:hypothetical protein